MTVWDFTVSIGDVLTFIGILLAVLTARAGLQRWRSEMTVRLIDEYADEGLSAARSTFRRWMREKGADADWRAAVGDLYDVNSDVAQAIGVLSRYYNRVGILVEQGVVKEALIVEQLRADVAVFEAPLEAWINQALARRKRDLEMAGKPNRFTRWYARGTRWLIRRCHRV